MDDPVHNVSKLLYGNILSAAPRTQFSFLMQTSNRFENILLRKIGGEQEHIRNNFDDLRDLRGKYCLCFDAEKTAEQSQQQKSSYIYLYFLDVSQLFALVFLNGGVMLCTAHYPCINQNSAGESGTTLPAESGQATESQVVRLEN